MPIHCSLQLRDATDEEFDFIDEAVMRCAYASQNHFGRLFDERVYENDMAARLKAEGFEIHTQVPIKVALGDFEKTYFLDLIVNQMPYELKAVGAFLPEHEAQALNYAMLQGIRRVKLVNLGGAKVRGRLLRNALSTAERHEPRIRKTGGRILTPHCERLTEHLKKLVKDWGTHLDSRLYNEALVHHFGGDLHCLHRADILADGQKLGTHLMQFYAPGHAFVTTSFSSHQPSYQKHLEILIDHASLDAIQWINLNRSCLEITTLVRKDRGMGTG